MAGVRVGLNYALVPGAAAACEVEATPQVWSDLRVLEDAALARWAEEG